MQEKSKIIVEGQALGKRFRSGDSELWAVERVSLQITAGEIIAVMGPSGSGKTTLLCLLGGLLTPSIGRVRLFGRYLAQMSATERAEIRLRNIGFIFQQGNLIGALSARDNIALAARLTGCSPTDACNLAARLLDTVGLRFQAHERPHHLSGGERQRVAVARALINQPKVVLADEPTANLDSKNRAHVLDLLCAAAKQQNAGVVIVTHDHRIEPLVDRVLRLEDGQLLGV